MKKSIFLAAIMLLSATVASARDYQHSIGVNVGSALGVTYKGYVRSSEHFVFQMDANVQFGATGKSIGWLSNKEGKSTKATDVDPFSFYSFVVNPNLMYQGNAGEWSWGALKWFIGGGIDAGILWDMTNFGSIKITDHSIWGKVNEHVIGGIEFDFKGAPLNLGIELRPGLGETFYIYDGGYMSEILFFDWNANLSLRYRI